MFRFLLIWVASCLFVEGRTPNVFTLGYISGSRRPVNTYDYERPGYQINGAISLAVDQINQLHPDSLLPKDQLDFQYEETYGREEDSIQHTARLCMNETISAIIGPQETCFHEARVASSFNVLMLSYFCQHVFKDDNNHKQFSTFVHVKPHVAQVSKSVASVLLKYNWTKIAFINSVEDEPTLRTAESIKKVLGDYGIQILKSETWKEPFFLGFEQNIFRNPFPDIVKSITDAARIFVIVGKAATYDGYIAFMNALEEAGKLDSRDYFVVGVYLDHYKASDPAKYIRGTFEKAVSHKSLRAFKHYLAVIPTPPVSGTYLEFHDQVNVYLTKEPFNFPWDTIIKKQVRPEAAYLHDAVMIYARALNQCLSKPKECPNPRDGNRLVKYILDRPYISAMGYGGYIDASGNAQGNYSLLALTEVREPRPGQTWNVGLTDIGIFLLNTDNRSAVPSLVFKPAQKFHWPRESGKPPPDEPPCGFDGAKCREKERGERDAQTLIAIGTASALVLLICVAVAACLMYRNMKNQREIASFLWKIDWKQLNVEKLQAYLNAANDTAITSLFSYSLIDLCRVLDVVFADIRIPKNLNADLGFWNNQVVAIKRLRKNHVVLTPEVMRELKTVRDIRNDNLCSFIGACLSPVCVVTEFCQRGSLKDVLYDENVALDDMFTSSIINDIVKGMCYLHMSPLRSHGSLKPQNCLVDSRFAIKITDYGLHEFKRNTHYDLLSYRDQNQHVERLLWTAPEILRAPYLPAEGTPMGDVYSFALVMYEIYGRSGPFGGVDLNPAEIVTTLRLGREGEPLRPPLGELEKCPEFVRNLMVDCWNENPPLRPDFHTIKARLKPLQGDMKPNIMDNVMVLIQRYANNLESLVAERTIQLEEEKKKTESLLYEILPRPVADHLIREERVEAEQFDSVTIFFSDIVGFTALSADSTPLEVVALLNDLYTLFDSLLEHYDAYKVETIGDSYMVCSGLPIRNGDTHAGVIASMALHLLDAIRSFRIRHRPTQQLLLRVGIHSGPVVAGVVGVKMPRYCLFGDTVNTTSRYESTGMPQRIHCSPQCKELLDNLGGYNLEARGTVHMKGKGDLTTYWLVDEDEVKKQKRQLHYFNSLSDLTRASPILAKWGAPAKRRMSNFRKTGTPTHSPADSRRRLDSESLNCTDSGLVMENGKGSLPNIMAGSKELKAQYAYKDTNGDVSMPLLKSHANNVISETQSANCTRTNSRELVTLDGILVS